MTTSTQTSQPRIAVVTGSARGIGKALAGELAREGMTVVLTGRRIEAAREAASDLDVRVHPCELDVTDAASVNLLFAYVERTFGRLDVLINNAAVAIDRGRAPSLADFETVTKTLDTNAVGTWRCCAQAVRLMRINGYGRIVNVSSHMSSLTAIEEATSAAYRVSKAAMNAITRLFAAETRDENILVNCASPGTVDTRMSGPNPEHSPEEAAKQLVWLSTLPDDGPSGGFFYGRQSLPW